MEDEDANLNAVNTLRDRYKCHVGYSGHQVGLAVAYAAAALGIMIEWPLVSERDRAQGRSSAVGTQRG